MSRGRDATSPWRMPAGAWKDVLMRTWKESAADNVGLVAAGVSFYAFLALLPLLGAIVLTYGLVADPQTVTQNMAAMTRVMPTDIARFIGEQLMYVVQTSGGKKGLGVLVALALALFSARNGAAAIVTALNIAYEEEEKRGLVKVNLLALLITAGAVAMAVFALLSMTVLAYVEAWLPSSPVLAMLSRLMSHLLLALAAAAAAATLYRFGPSRDRARWMWLTPGSLFFAAAWVLLTLGFGIYVANFGNYGATYGSLATVIILLTWLYLSSYILIFGAELNSELEHQTARDTTEGDERPLGQRNAWVADHVAQGTRAGEDGPTQVTKLG
ncbi:ribonuclease BN [Sphingobium sp. 22B]|uniref:YihY/virulence factor BrkB family protein n=1 Tax=unclassified Sphingobium TaxID=2611147 RepID=UPI000783E93D|nr:MULTISPECIES: YihY/virulence factor BrkB family protein [unclassified Sphingobium]KXU29248.1 ribonuclease BN [Sphingobium sp. AM]KYC31180.1 ribonuclease BN [Sphingobium sp. 22B]OAP31181.1 ribonuclease BN [Sphingobium sp. 20006FA]